MWRNPVTRKQTTIPYHRSKVIGLGLLSSILKLLGINRETFDAQQARWGGQDTRDVWNARADTPCGRPSPTTGCSWRETALESRHAAAEHPVNLGRVFWHAHRDFLAGLEEVEPPAVAVSLQGDE